MFKYAQTVLQLNSQLRSAGFSRSDQVEIIQAYALAAELFSARFRGCGKTFVSHLVGTASILAAHQAPMRVIVAGLLHAAYEQGDFGHSLRRGQAVDRVEMIAAIGVDAERLVDGYARMPWTAHAIKSYRREIGDLSVFRRELLFIRMANELEDHLNLSVAYCSDRVARLDRLQNIGKTMICLAYELGFSNLSTEMDEVFTENQREETCYEGLTLGSKSYLMPPRSFRRRYDNRLRAHLGRWRRAFRRPKAVSG